MWNQGTEWAGMNGWTGADKKQNPFRFVRFVGWGNANLIDDAKSTTILNVPAVSEFKWEEASSGVSRSVSGACCLGGRFSIIGFHHQWKLQPQGIQGFMYGYYNLIDFVGGFGRLLADENVSEVDAVLLEKPLSH